MRFEHKKFDPGIGWAIRFFGDSRREFTQRCLKERLGYYQKREWYEVCSVISLRLINRSYGEMDIIEVS